MWRWRRWWGGSTDTTLSTDTITIESQGGTIQLSNGAATTIDSGILTETTTINSSEHSSPLTTIENAESLTSTYQLEISINKIADSSGSTIGTAWSMLKLPDTGQTTSYTTTFGEDHDYTINSPSYTDNGNGTIADNVTGLMWVKSPDSTTRAWAECPYLCKRAKSLRSR